MQLWQLFPSYRLNVTSYTVTLSMQIRPIGVSCMLSVTGEHMKNGADSIESLQLERRARRIAAGHGAKCGKCGVALTAENPGSLLPEEAWRCAECLALTGKQRKTDEALVFVDSWQWCVDNALDNYPYCRIPEAYKDSTPIWINCSWCNVSIHQQNINGKRQSCTKYCGIRRSRNGGTYYPYVWPAKDPVMTDKTHCHHCGELFVAKRKSAKYCGGTCRQAARRSKHSWSVTAPSLDGCEYWYGDYTTETGAEAVRQRLATSYPDPRAKFSVRLVEEAPA